MLDGEYYNTNYGDGDVWKSENTIRINNVHGTASNPIVIKGDTPTGHTLRGDSDNIFQLRVSTYVVVEDLNIIGEVENIPLQDAWDHRFDYKVQGDDVTVYQRADPSLSAEAIEALVLPDISSLSVIRPSYYTTNGLLVQSSRYVTVKNCRVGYAPGTGLRIQSSDFVTVEGNLVHNSSRRSSVGNHGMVIHSVTNTVGGVTVSDEGYRINILGNTVRDNYNEVYSWSELKTFISPHIDEGKGIIIQKTDSTFDSGTGRILIANNVAYANGFSGVHTNYATKVDIYHNTVIENSATGRGVNVGISVSDSSKVNVKNNVGYSQNNFGGFTYNTDSADLTTDQIVFASNLVVGDLSNSLDTNDFIVSTSVNLGLQGAPDYRLSSGSSAEGLGDPSVLSIVPTDKDGTTRNNPPDLGAYEIPSSSTRSGGDPHFIGFHETFTYQGECTLLLLHSPSPGHNSNDDGNVTVHIRTTRKKNYSYISGIAIQIGHKIVELNEGGELYMDGVYHSIHDLFTTYEESSFSLTSYIKGRKKMIYKYVLDLGRDQSIHMHANRRMSMLYIETVGNFPEGTTGLLGSPTKKGLFDRTGNDVTGMDINIYGEMWQVRDWEPQLFKEPRGPQYPEKCLYTTEVGLGTQTELGTSLTNVKVGRKQRSLITIKDATIACSKVNIQERQFCIDDVMSKGDLELANDPFYN